MADLQISNLIKRFEGNTVVDKISLEVKDGEFVVLLGPSGCGKTTTLRCIAGMEIPDGGDILVAGKSVKNLQPKDRDVAMVFQNYALYPHMTVYDNIAFPLRMRKMSKDKIDQRVKDVAKLLHIERLLRRKPKQLSGGEQQRVALGRAIVRRPKLFLMDEPLSNLDAKLRFNTRAEIKRLQKELKVTTVYVTHDQGEAMALADRVAVMNKGIVLQYDRPGSVYARPGTAFVASFMGSPPMNMIESKVLEEQGKIWLDMGFSKYELPSELTDVVKTSVGATVLLGVHAEDLHISVDKSGGQEFQSEVYVVEPTGPNVVLDLKAGDVTLKSVSLLANLKPGDNVWVNFPPEKIHLYDAKTEQIII